MKRHSHKSTILILFTAVLLGACSKETKIEAVDSPLDVDSKNAFFDVLSSMARTSRAVEIARKGNGSAEPAAAHPADVVLNPEETLTKMADNLKESDCSLDYERDKNPLKPASAFVFEFDQAVADGMSCPVNLKIASTKASEHEGEGLDENRTTINSEVSYEVADEAFKKLNDVDSFQLKGDSAFKYENTKSVRKRILRWNGRLVLEGTIHSQKYGALKYVQKAYYTGQGSPDGKEWRSNLELSIEIQFPDFKASLRTVQQENGTSLVPGPYYLNGEEVPTANVMGLIASELPIRIKSSSN